MNEPRIQPFTLRFGVPLESEFLDRYYDQSIRLIRISLTMGFFLYASFGWLDTFAVPEKLEEVWFIRFGIVCPCLALTALWTFHRSFRRYSQLVLMVLGLIAGGAVIVMTVLASPPANHLYQTGVMTVLMFFFSVPRLRFVYAMTTAVILIVAYNVVALAMDTRPGWIILNHNFFLFAAMIVGGFASYAIELYARRNFLQSRTIENKNEELSAANRELVESRQAILESSRRAQLIFSALADALPGTTLDDKYEVGEKIGSGGFGTVYRGKHLLLDAPVAIKIFRPTDTKNLEKSFERFRIEGVSAKRIRHPNAVEVLDFGISASALAFLVMELLEGHTLSEEIRALGMLPPRRCAEIIVPVCSVLAEAHALGIIHRDIKPGNIFLHRGNGEVVKVVDFGIAKLTDTPTPQNFDHLTATGAVIGTPSYMAPERFWDAPYGVSSDIYSIGVVLFEMLTGQLPFASKPEMIWRAAFMKSPAPAPSPRFLVPEIPVAFDKLVMQALSSHPEQRPSAQDMAREIAELFEISPPMLLVKKGGVESGRIPIADPASHERETESQTPPLIDTAQVTQARPSRERPED